MFKNAVTANRPPPSGRITLMFTDIEDSSRMTNALGDDVYLKDMRAPHNERIHVAIKGHNGHQVKTIGDAFMVAFDRADDALSCAVAIQRSLAAPSITRESWTIKVRIGIHTAEYELFPDEQGDYGGADVNFAARVESLGAGGQTIVSGSTYRAAGSRQRYQWQEWRDRRIKSFDQPETVWELLWDGRNRGEPGARWLPDWFKGERNRYISRSALEKAVLGTFGKLQPDGSTPRLITVHGIGGMGKTRLALACAIQAVGAFKDGVFFVSLADKLPLKEAIAEAIGAAFGMAGEAALPDNLFASLQDKEILLILDNYEAVDSDEVAGYITALLTQTRYLRLLVTGREAVKLNDVEQLIHLDEGMMDEEAEQLFIARAGSKKGQGWQPDVEEQSHLKRILTLTDRIPLAIELAAAWMDKRTVAEIADDIETTPLISEPSRSRRTSEAERHRSLTRCLDWSFNLLEDWTQDGFARLGVFANTFTAETVSAACDVPNAQELLDRLQDAALVRRLEVGGYSRYAMHHFTRAYAAEKLDALSDAPRIRECFLNYFRRLVRANQDINDPAKRAILDSEWRNAITAAEIAQKLAKIADKLKDPNNVVVYRGAVFLLSEHLGEFLLRRGLWSEREWLNKCALAAARTAGRRDWEQYVLSSLGIVYAAQGRWVEAEKAHEQSLSIPINLSPGGGGILGRRKRKPVDSQAEKLNDLGEVYRVQGRLVEAEGCFQRSLKGAQEIGDRPLEGAVLNNLGLVHEQQGQLAEAEKYFECSLEIARETGDRMLEGTILNNLGVVYQSQGQWADAERCYKRSLATWQEVGDRVREGSTLNNLGRIYRLQKRWVEAQAACQQSLAIRRESGDCIGEGYTLENLAQLRAAQGDIAGALEVGRQAIAVLETTEDTGALAQVRKVVAEWERPRVLPIAVISRCCKSFVWALLRFFR